MKIIEKIKEIHLLEKLENKKVFALYLVGVLLLSAGVSFAYFTARTTSSGSGGVATGLTATVQSDGVIADGNVGFSNTDIYPGHQAVASIRVTGRGDNEPLIFNVIFNGNNTFNTPINYTIYKTEENIDASYNCSVKKESVGINTIYYEECTGSNIEQLGISIGSGTIIKGEGKTILKSDEIILTEPEGKEVYYYIVFEYPNLDASQNDDIGSIINGNITVEEGSEYQQPELFITAATTSGSNGWYKSASLTTSITTQTENYDVKYCITTENSCTPNEIASITDNSFTTTLNSNANPQNLCVRVTDEYNQVGEGCSEAYKVDGENPSSNVTLASSTSGSNGWYRSISINVNGNDSHSGIASIRYCTTTSSSCTPSTNVNGSSTSVTLSSNASGQRVCAYAIDTAGNTSSTTCSSAYNVDTTNPTVSITSTSSTQNSISVTVSGSDSHSGIYQYRFSSNGGSSYTTVTSSNSTYTYTFTGLSGGTTYNIRVQAVDRSGRTSSTASRSVATESANAGDTLLANYPTQLTRSRFSSTVTNTTTGTIYYADTSKGRTYYFAGNPTDNWVRWAGFYWRIIRINEDGTIRMIYQGTSANTTGTGTQTETSTFSINSSTYDNNAYVGYMYTLGSLRGTTTDSGIKKKLDTWYQNNLARYADDLDGNAGFCGDRTPSTSSSSINNSGGTGTTQTYYAGYVRYYGNTSLTPTFECTNDSDLYTTSGSEDGNKALQYPIGLISMDEVWYAGGYQANNTSYYLYTGQNYWTMSPNRFYNRTARVFLVKASGNLNGDFRVTGPNGVRPVVNLKADVQITGGDGSSGNPYVIS